MKVAIYSPYLDTAGGGEKYILTIAQVLSDQSQVDVLLDKNLQSISTTSIREINEKRHGLDLSKISFIPAPIGAGSSFWERVLFLRKYDLLFYNSDGSWFYTTAKKSIIHFQIPFTYIKPNNLWQRIKLSTWSKAIYNSKFTKDIIRKQLQIAGQVVYPPVNVDHIKPLSKKKQIMSVGRFAAHTKSKKHEVMISAFKELVKNQTAKGWQLILVGGMLEGDKGYVEELKKGSLGSDINILPNISLESLRKLYGESSIYWHAAGFGERNPEKFEHFGISTVEAMAAGCVPVVINLGGQKEIVENNVSGYLWDLPQESVEYTLELIKGPKLLQRMADNAILRSKGFSSEKFAENIKKIVYE